MGTEVNESGNVRLEAWKHIGRQFLLAMCASFLFLRLILARYLNPEHRFYVHWQRSDVLGIYLAIFVVAVVLFAGYRLVSSLGKLGQFAAQGFFVMFSIFYIKVAVFEMSGLYRETNTIANVAAKIILVLIMLEFLRYRKKALEDVMGSGFRLLSSRELAGTRRVLYAFEKM